MAEVDHRSGTLAEPAGGCHQQGGTDASNGVLGLRVAAALVRAGVLYALLRAATPPSGWPATQPAWFLPVALIAAGVPLLVMLGVERLPGWAVAGWSMVAAATLTGSGAVDPDAELAVRDDTRGFTKVAALGGAFFVAGVVMLPARLLLYQPP